MFIYFLKEAKMDVDKLQSEIEAIQDFLAVRSPDTEEYQQALECLQTLQRIDNDMCESRTKVDCSEDEIKIKKDHEKHSTRSAWGTAILAALATVGAAGIGAVATMACTERVVRAEKDEDVILTSKALGFIPKPRIR
jgi:2-oxoglutarate dehydrogenase complex dehydrogenase (E1) component-like enzyme